MSNNTAIQKSSKENMEIVKKICLLLDKLPYSQAKFILEKAHGEIGNICIINSTLLQTGKK